MFKTIWRLVLTDLVVNEAPKTTPFRNCGRWSADPAQRTVAQQRQVSTDFFTSWSDGVQQPSPTRMSNQTSPRL